MHISVKKFVVFLFDGSLNFSIVHPPKIEIFGELDFFMAGLGSHIYFCGKRPI